MWDRTAQSDAPLRNAALMEGIGGLSVPQVWGPPPRIFIANISSEKGILGKI